MLLDATDQIRRFNEFFELNYKIQLLERIRKGEKFLIIDFSELLKSDLSLSEDIMEFPEETIKAAEIALSEIEDKASGFKIRFSNLPESQKMMIRNIRSMHMDKIFIFEGVVRQKSDVRPQVISAKFECPGCNAVINVLQLDSSFKEPFSCSCGRKGKFKVLSQELVDAQGIVLEEVPENLEGGEQPKRINVLLKDDLVSPMSERRTNPGSKISVVGIIKEVPIILRTGGKSTKFDLIINANYVNAVEEDFYEVEISEEEENKIKELASDKGVYQKLKDSIAPSIFGYDEVKEALLLQLVGGVLKERKDGVISRGDMHVLLVGDPGSGKSALLKRVYNVAPKGRYVSGKGVSAAGLTASVVRDEFLKGWSLEAGAMVLASNGLCCIDELDKMSDEDRSAMHEAMENQTVSISKANIQATLISKTTVLAAANPKLGRFNPYEVLAKQIDLPPTLINRFDLIFPIKDVPNRARDESMAQHILSLHQNPDIKEPEIDTRLLRKYIAYARQKLKPILSNEALEEIKNHYVEIRNKEFMDESAAKAIPISPRQLEALVRMAEGYAKIRLSNIVSKEDARRSINMLQYSMSQVGLDPETGKIDIDRIATGISASQRNKILILKDIIDELENKIGKTIPIEDIMKEAEMQKISKSDTEDIIDNLKKSGDIFEPKRGFIQRIG